MNKDFHHKPSSNFWFGLSIGISSALIFAYFFGTKKGREYLKKMLEIAENLPEDLDKLLENEGKTQTNLSGFNLEGIMKKIKQTASVKSFKKLSFKDK